MLNGMLPRPSPGTSWLSVYCPQIPIYLFLFYSWLLLHSPGRLLLTCCNGFPNKKAVLYRATSWQAEELGNLCQSQHRTSGRCGKKGCGIYSICVTAHHLFFVAAKSSQKAQTAMNSSLSTSSCQSLWCSSQPGSHRVQGQTLKGTWERGWGLTGYMHKKEFQLWILTLLTGVTACDYAKHVLTSLLSFVRRQHFIQSYTVSPTHRGKGHRVKDEIPQQYQLLQQPGAQHTGQREILLCQVLTGHKQTEALCQGDTELHPGNSSKI